MISSVKKLWKRYRLSEQIEDRDALIVHYLHLVKKVVGRMASNLPSHIKIDDLYSSGVTGLIRAVTRYDPSRKTKFESYATLLIKGAIVDELRELDWVPRSIHQTANKIAEAEQVLQQKLGRDPTDSELSLHMGVSENQLTDLFHRIRPAVLIPLNASVSDDEENSSSMSERIADVTVKTSDEIAMRNQFAKLLRQAIEDLPDQQKKVLVLYYYEERMLKEIGEILGVSESRISQIHTKALLTLRRKLRPIANEIVL